MSTYATETPVLESVFVALAPDADSIQCIVTRYPLLALRWSELVDWTDEISKGLSTIHEHAGMGLS